MKKLNLTPEQKKMIKDLGNEHEGTIPAEALWALPEDHPYRDTFIRQQKKRKENGISYFKPALGEDD